MEKKNKSNDSSQPPQKKKILLAPLIRKKLPFKSLILNEKKQEVEVFEAENNLDTIKVVKTKKKIKNAFKVSMVSSLETRIQILANLPESDFAEAIESVFSHPIIDQTMMENLFEQLLAWKGSFSSLLTRCFLFQQRIKQSTFNLANLQLVGMAIAASAEIRLIAETLGTSELNVIKAMFKDSVAEEIYLKTKAKTSLGFSRFINLKWKRNKAEKKILRGGRIALLLASVYSLGILFMGEIFPPSVIYNASYEKVEDFIWKQKKYRIGSDAEQFVRTMKKHKENFSKLLEAVGGSKLLASFTDGRNLDEL